MNFPIDRSKSEIANPQSFGLACFAIAVSTSACILFDEPAVPGITIAPEEVILAVGDTVRLDANVFVPDQPNADPEVSWRAGSQAASVDGDGLVTARMPGELDITGSVPALGINAYSSVVVIDQFWWLAAGKQHTCGLGSLASLYCWGDNVFGQLGDGTTTDRATPTAVNSGVPWGAFEILVRCLSSTLGAWRWGITTRASSVATP